MESYLDGVCAYVEYFCNLGVRKFFEFAEEEDLAVVFGQLVDNAADAGIHLPANVLLVNLRQAGIGKIINRAVVINSCSAPFCLAKDDAA